MNSTNIINLGKGFTGLRTVATGITSIVLVQLMGINFSISTSPQTSLNSHSVSSAINFDFSTETGANASTLMYTPPNRGALRRTEGTGSRGGGDYIAPNRGAPVNTQGTGARGDYTVPNRGTLINSQGTGSRGGNVLPLTLTLLIPNDHTGQTVSSHPTFFWYLSDAAYMPMEFTLVEPGKTAPIFVKQISNPHAGITQIEMPTDLPGLVTGRKYRWSVALVRNSKRRSNDVFVQGWIERVATTPDLTKQLATATSERQRSGIYASAGLWYDALRSISMAHLAAPNDQAIIQERLSLLEQAGQKEVVKQERNQLVQKP